MEILLNSQQVNETIQHLVEQIQSDIPSGTDIAVIGIRSRGEILARRLVEVLQKHFTSEILNGTLDITLYRDDLNNPNANQPTVRSTEIEFDITDKLVLVVDDVLHTGRSVRAAMDALTDLGRPRLMRLAVLVDRGHHEYPICADYVGITTDVDESSKVRVHFIETDQQEQVIAE